MSSTSPLGDPRPLYVVLRAGARDGALAAATRCLKRLFPGACVLVAPEAPPAEVDGYVVTLDAEEVAAGPLSVASALERERERGRDGTRPLERA